MSSSSGRRSECGGLVGSGHRLLLGLGVLLVGAEDLDLLPLPVQLRRLGAGLEQVQGLAVLL